MTDRFHSLQVALDQDMREDDAQALMDAIRMMRGVVAVSGAVAGPDSWMAEERARQDLGRKLWEILYPKQLDASRGVERRP